MTERICLIGLDEPEAMEIKGRVSQPVMIREFLPRIKMHDGKLFVESDDGFRFHKVAKVVFHGIFEDDLDVLAALAIWRGPCFPNARAMMDCRLRLPCLVHALEYSHFPMPRGYLSAKVEYQSECEGVAKWGNWHCGENKIRFSGKWESEHNSLIEPFLAGEAVRVLLFGEHAWQVRLTGKDWLKSVHGDGAAFMPMDEELAEDTRRIQTGIGLDVIANDYIVTESGSKHLLEVNHIPSITCFPEIREAYLDHVIRWLGKIS